MELPEGGGPRGVGAVGGRHQAEEAEGGLPYRGEVEGEEDRLRYQSAGIAIYHQTNLFPCQEEVEEGVVPPFLEEGEGAGVPPSPREEEGEVGAPLLLHREHLGRAYSLTAAGCWREGVEVMVVIF